MTEDDKGNVYWKTDPRKFLKSEAFKYAVIKCSGIIRQSDYDPWKIEKDVFSHTPAENSIRLAFFKLQQQVNDRSKRLRG